MKVSVEDHAQAVQRQPAASRSEPVQAGPVEASAQVAPASQAAWSNALQHSPRLTAQRHAIQSCFGTVLQHRSDGLDDEVQLRSKAAGSLAVGVAQARTEPVVNQTGMPDPLKAGVESLSGMDMSDVRVHANSDKPAQLNALAYAQGNDIHLGPGQERHLPHEAWHVVQQRQGRVSATMQMKSGVAVNDDGALEAEADAMGARAAAQGVAGTLNPLRAQLAKAPGAWPSRTIQRATVKTAGGEFSTSTYAPQVTRKFGPDAAVVGAEINLSFVPKPLLPCAEQPIGLVQTVRQQRTELTREEQYDDDKTKLRRMLPDGTHIDQSSFASPTGGLLTDDEAKKTPGAVRQTNPVFHSNNRAGQVAANLMGSTAPNTHGRNYDPATRTPAGLVDHPGRVLFNGETLIHTFEVTALTLAGPSQYLGSITWGYRARNANGTVAGTTTTIEPNPIALATLGDPSAQFLGAAARWNNQDFGIHSRDPVRLPIPAAQTMEVRAAWLLSATLAAAFYKHGQRDGMVASFKDKSSFANPGGWAFGHTRALLSKGQREEVSDGEVLGFMRTNNALMTETILHFYDAIPGGLMGADWGPSEEPEKPPSEMEEVD